VLLFPGRIYVALVFWVLSQSVIPIFVNVRERPRDRTARVRGLPMILRTVARRGIGVSLANAIARLGYRVDLFVVAALLSVADVGRYSVAIAIAEALWQVSRAAGTGVYAAVIDPVSPEATALTLRSFRHSILLLTTGGFCAVVAAAVLFEPLLGAGFAGIWRPLALVVPGIVALGAAEMLQPFLLIRLESSREYLRTYATATAVNLLVALALVPWIGIAGAAVSTSIAYSAAALYLARRFQRLAGGVSPGDFVPGPADIRDYQRLGSALFRGVRGNRP
jgi:O-antigen/teichoic acid export membrane protein